MELLENSIRRYGWGSCSAIAALQGRPVPSPEPEAELWVGAHPVDPSRVASSGTPLPELISAAPARMLGEPVLARFGPRLPYLLKLLAAERPLSLQAHPDAAQAAAGYAAEEAAGLPRTAPQRRYVDPSHKPELLVAVTEFRALCGFRDPAESARLLAGLRVPSLAPVVALLQDGELGQAVRTLLEWPTAARPRLVQETVDAAGRAAGYALIPELAAHYPADVGVLVALLLNELRLAPEEAIFMPAGNLHAYLHGVGIEIMAASDNVLRGGLSSKHVDPRELLRVLRFTPWSDSIRVPVRVGPGIVTWPVPVDDFSLHRVRLDREVRRARLSVPGPRAVLCLAGEFVVDDGVSAVTICSGQAAFGPPGEPVELHGAGVAYVASAAA